MGISGEISAKNLEKLKRECARGSNASMATGAPPVASPIRFEPFSLPGTCPMYNADDGEDPRKPGGAAWVTGSTFFFTDSKPGGGVADIERIG
jgi:hypothetical protein